MAIVEIGGKEFDVPDNWNPEQIKDTVFGQFPELDPRRSVIKGGLAKGMEAYSDVVTAGTKAIEFVAGFPAHGGAVPTTPEQKVAFEKMTQQQGERKAALAETFDEFNKPRQEYWRQTVEKYQPVYNPEAPVASTLKVAAADAIGLALETPP